MRIDAYGPTIVTVNRIIRSRDGYIIINNVHTYACNDDITYTLLNRHSRRRHYCTTSYAYSLLTRHMLLLF